MKNTFGSDLSLTIFGESHGRAVGAVLDGMAAGVPVDEAFLAATSAIAQFFCDFYKTDLKRRAEELSVKSQRIDSLVSKLEQMKKI